MITIDSLTVRAGGRTLLDRLTMHLSEGRIHGIVGIDGAGKTTLLNALYGIAPAASGSITRNGRPLRHRETSYLEHGPSFYPGLTGRDYLDLLRHYHPSSDPEPCMELFALPLDEEVCRWPADKRQELALAAAFMQEGELLLLDEPFEGLPPRGRTGSPAADPRSGAHGTHGGRRLAGIHGIGGGRRRFVSTRLGPHYRPLRPLGVLPGRPRTGTPFPQ